jgi:hypothetical protein
MESEQQTCAELTPEHATVAPSAHAPLETAGFFSNTHWLETAKGHIFLDEAISRNSSVQAIILNVQGLIQYTEDNYKDVKPLIDYTHTNNAAVLKIDENQNKLAEQIAGRLAQMHTHLKEVEARCNENSDLIEQVSAQQTKHYEELTERFEYVIFKMKPLFREHENALEAALPSTVHAHRANSLFV